MQDHEYATLKARFDADLDRMDRIKAALIAAADGLNHEDKYSYLSHRFRDISPRI